MKKFLLMYFSFVLALSTAWAQERVVSGKVTSTEDGSTLPGVNVVVKGTTNGTVTDSNGAYSLNVPGTGGTLVFSFIGFQTQEVSIGDQTIVDAKLGADITQLSEVVVGPFKKKKTYEEHVGDRALEAVGKKKWNRRVREVLAQVQPIFNPDRIYLGGGNAKHLRGALPKNVKVTENLAGLLGGIALWKY